jgi:hypothetical protein
MNNGERNLLHRLEAASLSSGASFSLSPHKWESAAPRNRHRILPLRFLFLRNGHFESKTAHFADLAAIVLFPLGSFITVLLVCDVFDLMLTLLFLEVPVADGSRAPRARASQLPLPTLGI